MRFIRQLRRFLDDERGLAPVEYALILMILAVASVVGAAALANAVGTKLMQMRDGLDIVSAPGPPDPT